MKKSRPAQSGDFIIYDSVQGCFYIVAFDGKCLVFFPGEFQMACQIVKQRDIFNVAKMFASAANLQIKKVEINTIKLSNTPAFFGGIKLEDGKHTVCQLY